MLQYSKQADERREAGPLECWCLHGAVGVAADWRGITKRLAAAAISSRAVDLWRFLDDAPLPLAAFGKALNTDAGGDLVIGGTGRVMLGDVPALAPAAVRSIATQSGSHAVPEPGTMMLLAAAAIAALRGGDAPAAGAR